MEKRQLDTSSPIPLHHQLSEVLKKEILTGKILNERSKLPAEAELVEKFGVSRITVRKAIQTLVDNGLIVRARGKGTFLKTKNTEVWSGKLMGFSEYMKTKGIQTSSKVIKAEKVSKIPEKASSSLRIEEGWQLKRLRMIDNRPVALESSIYPLQIGKEFEKQNLEEILTYQFIETKLGILLNEGTQEISAVKATEEEAKLFNMSTGDPLLRIERVTFSYNGEPIEYLKALFNPAYFTYSVSLSRHY